LAIRISRPCAPRDSAARSLASTRKCPAPAKVAGTLSVVLWVGMALGLLVAAIGARFVSAPERPEP
jgi:hypothetical protein